MSKPRSYQHCAMRTSVESRRARAERAALKALDPDVKKVLDDLVETADAALRKVETKTGRLEGRHAEQFDKDWEEAVKNPEMQRLLPKQ